MGTGEEESTPKSGYYRLMLYAALFGALFSLITAGYITLYNQGIKFFGQPTVYLFNINFWPLILLGVAGYGFQIPEYSYPEFEAISVRIIKKLPQNTVIQIASSVWKSGSRDIRDVLKIAKLCNPADTEEDISRLISISQKYRKTGKEYN
jgi:hypothetical protein